MRGPDTIIQASLTPHSTHGHSIHDVDRVDASNIHRFLPHHGRRATAARRLRALGFDVHDHGGSTLTVRGRRALFDQVFGKRADRTGLFRFAGRQHHELASVASGLAVCEPVKLFGAAVRPPTVRYPHVSLPRGLADVLRARPAHRAGFSGKGVRVAICDTGFFRHPWFLAQHSRVRVQLTPGSSAPDADDIGHGTMVAANLLSIAPRCSVIAIKMNFTGPESFSDDAVAGLTMAEASGADIVSCSWGTSVADASDAKSAHLRTVEFLLSRLVAEGRIVLCASGNYPRGGVGRGEYGFPAQHPDVIAVGGAHVTKTGRLRASTYASGFQSEVYPYRGVPDVSGICGDIPNGVLIMSPVQPGCVMDVQAAAARYPTGDDTRPDDGWCCVSGTSAATPQVAGAAALALEANRALKHNSTMRALLALTARDVRHGHGNPKTKRNGLSNKARRGPDLVTGAGLIDVGAAVALAMWMKG